MSQLWEVVGGATSGGILVREGKELSSAKKPERLSKGAFVQEITLEGERLHFQLIVGSGPRTGWVGTVLNGKPLVVKTVKKPPVIKAGENMNTHVASNGIIDKVKNDVLLGDENLKENIAASKGAEEFDLWCAKYKVLKFPLANCRFRVLCFHMAGSAESVWTQPAGNDLLSWVQQRGDTELVAMSYPGRDKLVKSPPHESMDSLVKAMLPVLYNKIVDGVPYAVVAHSVGTWVAFELLMMARKLGLPMPEVAFLGGFPAPHIANSERPWRVNRKLSSAEMQEETRSWDREHFEGAAKVIFTPAEWSGTWEALMRADFRLFDEYECQHMDEPKFGFPISSFYMGKEEMIKPGMMELWKDWTSNTFSLTKFDDMGHLTCLYQPKKKTAYMSKIVESLTEIVLAHEQKPIPAKPSPPPLPVCLMFPGQGSQYVTMLSSTKDLPDVKSMLDIATDILGYDLLKLCLEGPEEKLAETKYCQPAMFVGGLAGIAKLRGQNPEAVERCQCVAGLSLGEYTALCVAGVFSFEDGLRLVKLRGEAMQKASESCQQAMVSVAGLEERSLKELCMQAASAEDGGICQIANSLFPKGYACAGTLAAIEQLKSIAIEKGAMQAKVLKTGGAFHCPLMKSAQVELEMALQKTLPRMNPPKCDVYMNVTGKALKAGSDPARIAELLSEQLVMPVLWEECMRQAMKDGTKEFYEVGPQKQLKAMMKRIDMNAWNKTTGVEV